MDRPSRLSPLLILAFVACGDTSPAPGLDSRPADVVADIDAASVAPDGSDLDLPSIPSDAAAPAEADATDATSSEPSDTLADIDASSPSADVAPTDSSPVDAAPADAAPVVAPCPAITIAEGALVSPPETLHLSGLGTTGTVARWQWSLVSKPAHAFTTFRPSATVAEPTFEAAVAGTYVFKLDAFDSLGRAACDPAELTVVARPTAAIHLELWWNDNTADPTAEVGADLDLHVMHPDAVGIDVNGDQVPDRWFDPVYDVAWHNPVATWPGPEGAPEQGPLVQLLRRDDAGYGPEVITIERPRDGDVYTVGFHLWDDSNTVYLQPTEIRIFIDGELKNKPSYAVPLSGNVFERVMTIRWPWSQTSLGFPFARDGNMRPSSPTKP